MKVIKRLSVMIISFVLLVGCSSGPDLSLSHLKELYPEAFATPIEALPQEKQQKLGLPQELPFELQSLEAVVEGDEVEVIYQSETTNKALVRTIFNPGNDLEESELQIPLDSGILAGVQEREDHVFVEWYNGDKDVIYQLEYSSEAKKEERLKQTMEITNSIE
ncbi:hypothetical protein MUO14_19265 [Halobacillus shinanisalinarum]|uniref:DUF4367 domain-containing protein n=1 Tax=Halobacillus shinanisalinarum TaxID=2932258 RepID=A0ABY4GX27_9BACI|nr:hypothetical protein [Halobacillus shinanisalinarum]UOQ92566.1 hypothetical protein MUO14_19265 [Halobacillus shinanisalinarum]